MAKARVTPALPTRVIGIGASAGGLDAFKQLIARLPVDTGFAFVVLQHLPPSQAGLLRKLLATATKLPVLDLETGHRVEPNTIFVVPPHTSAALHRGALVLRAATPGTRPKHPIDGLFQSIAAVLAERAVGIVLSGTGDDGTEGLRAIQKVGGLTFAQQPSTAQFDDMPRSAIAAGAAELVLPPAQIGEELGILAVLGPRPSRSKSLSAIDRVLEQLRDASGIDFTSYKRSTIERRLARRVSQHNLSSLDEYSAYLGEHPNEARAVYEDLLIHVTEFFRDRAVLETVVRRMMPELVQPKASDSPVRVWVPGCSTGEEVYSLAMLLVEHMGDQPRPLQMFGSDLSERAIETARRATYPEAIAAAVGAERIKRFFQRHDGGYRVRKELRECCVFVRHDLVNDPPFSNLDLVSCRNVLIYLSAELQRRVIPVFHYALSQPGFLLLGSAEAISGFDHLFAPIDAEGRIYARKPAARSVLTFAAAGHLTRQQERPASETVRSALDIQRDVDHVLLARYAPPCVVVNEQLEIVQFRGRTAPYLEQPPGQPQLNVLRLARRGVAAELSIALERARQSEQPSRREGVAVTDQGAQRNINLEVVPVRSSAAARPHFLVVFEDVPKAGAAAPKKRSRKPTPSEDADVLHLRQELSATKEYLHSVVTQHIATSEALGVTNEELQSANEELLSSNEELQTAKEELQSTNEELETVNEELHRSNELLQETNDDLVNVLASVEIAIIIVDNLRRVRRFTPQARSVMKLIPGDIGRPIADLRPSVAMPQLDGAIAYVIETLETREEEVRHADGTWYRMQIRPYQTAEHKVNGATVTFVDITTLLRAREHAAAIVEAVPTPLAVIDERLRVQSVNRAFVTVFGAPAVASELVEHESLRSPVLRELLREAVSASVVRGDVEVEHPPSDRVLRVGVRPMPALEGQQLFLVAIADVTERRRLEHAREGAERERTAFLDAVSHELRTPLSAIVLWAEALRELAPNDPRRLRAIETILQSARAEARLVDDVLELSLARTAALVVQVESLEPASIVRAAIESVRPDAVAKQISIESHVEPDGKIAADPNRLRQIAARLIANAVKFTPPGGSVGVELSVRDATMELRVRNSGPAIPPEFIARVFEPFSQADTSHTRAWGGLGIGLALVRHFVERHGGTVEVVSPGGDHGTTFTVRIPART